MSFYQTYVLNAAAGKEAAVEAAALRLASVIRELDGCEGVKLLRDGKCSRRYVFVEQFRDAAAHEASSTSVPRAIFTELISVLAGKPEGQALTTVFSDGSFLACGAGEGRAEVEDAALRGALDRK